MIIKLNSKWHNKVLSYLRKDPEFNLFIIGDIERYGYDNYFLNIWADVNSNDKIQGILLKYFEYITLYTDKNCDIKGFYELISTMEFSEINGKTESVRPLATKLKLDKKREVNFCKLNTGNFKYKRESTKLKKIRLGNLNKVVRLYELIDEFEDTSLDNIKNGLKTGRGYCIERDKKVIAMAKSTSETKTHAMIVGVGTHPEYRNQGLATTCIIKICHQLIKEGKVPCLFYDNEDAGRIYNRLGFEKIGTWSIYYR